MANIETMGRKFSMIDNINGELRRNGLSKKEFCDMIGVELRTYTRWQSKGEMPSSKLIKSAEVLRCSLDYLARDN